MNTVDKILQTSKEKGITVAFLCRRLGLSGRTYFTDIKRNNRTIPDDKLQIIADTLNVSVDYLLGKADAKKEYGNLQIVDMNGYRIPVFESVSAGFGSLATDNIIGYTVCDLHDPAQAAESIAIKVKGDSMYPKIEDGDIVVVHKQTSVDSGSIAVVLLDGDEGLVKKVVYGPTWIELHSINPMYPVMRFDDRDVLRLRVVGRVLRIVKYCS